MPIYEYHCSQCDEIYEFLQKFSDKPMTQCPNCQKATLERKISAASFHLKGSGWYVTDFKDKNKKDQDKNENKTADKSEGPKSEEKKSTEKTTKAASATKPQDKE